MILKTWSGNQVLWNNILFHSIKNLIHIIFFIIINVDIQASLYAPQLISRSLKLTVT
jgi:hypothetical protein